MKYYILHNFRTSAPYIRINPQITLRPVLFVVRVMSDISKQDCLHSKQIPQSTKMRIRIHHP